jgi:hypothetical protein
MAASHSSSVLPFKCAISLDSAYKKDESKVGFISAADFLKFIDNGVSKNIKGHHP